MECGSCSRCLPLGLPLACSLHPAKIEHCLSAVIPSSASRAFALWAMPCPAQCWQPAHPLRFSCSAWPALSLEASCFGVLRPFLGTREIRRRISLRCTRTVAVSDKILVPAPNAVKKGESMKAIRMHSKGGPELLAYEDAPKPQLQPGDAMVRVSASSITKTELTWSETYTACDGTPRLPTIPGHEFSGVVEEITARRHGCEGGRSCLRTRFILPGWQRRGIHRHSRRRSRPKTEDARSPASGIRPTGCPHCLASALRSRVRHQGPARVDPRRGGRRGSLCCANCELGRCGSDRHRVRNAITISSANSARTR